MEDSDDDWINSLNVQYHGEQQDPDQVRGFIAESLGKSPLPDIFDSGDVQMPALQEVAKTCRFADLLVEAVNRFRDRWCQFEDDDVILRWCWARADAAQAKSVIEIDIDFKALKFGVQPTVKLEVFAVEGVTAPWPNLGHRQPVDQDVTAEAGAQTAQRWLADCMRNHPQCRLLAHTAKLPTRVIDVRGPSLFITNGLAAPYAALSHCWGDPKICHMCTTTKSSLAEFQDALPWERLSKTFQDAITFTRELGLHYLWIDSLCIVQDDADDWAVESTKMATVYGDAHLVLAATAGSSGNHGCLFPRGPTHRVKFKPSETAPGTTDEGSQSEIFVREVIMHTELLSSHKSPLSAIAYARNRESPLLSRAWCYQEQLLAHRMLHFHAHELRWDCLTMRTCECGGIRSAIDVRENHRTSGGSRWTLPTAPNDENLDKLLAEWSDQVARYSIRSITYDSDRLIALAGIASTFQCEQLGRYVAGLWEKTLLEGLQWERPSRMDLEFEQSLRPKAYRSPSWSWASLEGDVGFRNTVGTTFDASAEIKSVDFELENTLSPYGSVNWAKIDIQGNLFHAQLRVEEYELNCCSSLYMEGSQEVLKFRTDVPAAPWLPQQTATPEVQDGMRVGCLHLGLRSGAEDTLMGGTYPPYHVMLVVSESEHHEGGYRRVGILHVEPKQMENIGIGTRTTLVLV